MKKAIPYFADNKLRSVLRGGASPPVSPAAIFYFISCYPPKLQRRAAGLRTGGATRRTQARAEFISGLETCLSRNSPLFQLEWMTGAYVE